MKIIFKINYLFFFNYKLLGVNTEKFKPESVNENFLIYKVTETETPVASEEEEVIEVKEERKMLDDFIFLPFDDLKSKPVIRELIVVIRRLPMDTTTNLTNPKYKTILDADTSSDSDESVKTKAASKPPRRLKYTSCTGSKSQDYNPYSRVKPNIAEETDVKKSRLASVRRSSVCADSFRSVEQQEKMKKYTVEKLKKLAKEDKNSKIAEKRKKFESSKPLVSKKLCFESPQRRASTEDLNKLLTERKEKLKQVAHDQAMKKIQDKPKVEQSNKNRVPAVPKVKITEQNRGEFLTKITHLDPLTPKPEPPEKRELPREARDQIMPKQLVAFVKSMRNCQSVDDALTIKSSRIDAYSGLNPISSSIISSSTSSGSINQNVQASNYSPFRSQDFYKLIETSTQSSSDQSSPDQSSMFKAPRNNFMSYQARDPRIRKQPKAVRFTANEREVRWFYSPIQYKEQILVQCVLKWDPSSVCYNTLGFDEPELTILGNAIHELSSLSREYPERPFDYLHLIRSSLNRDGISSAEFVLSEYIPSYKLGTLLLLKMIQPTSKKEIKFFGYILSSSVDKNCIVPQQSIEILSTMNYIQLKEVPIVTSTVIINFQDELEKFENERHKH